jgi:hypothetical protein
LIKPNIFASSQPTIFYEADMKSAIPTFVEDDRYVWFVSGTGMARLDIKEQKWCLLNRFITDVPLTQDDKGDIWMIAGHQIYKHNSSQKQ